MYRVGEQLRKKRDGNTGCLLPGRVSNKNKELESSFMLRLPPQPHSGSKSYTSIKHHPVYKLLIQHDCLTTTWKEGGGGRFVLMTTASRDQHRLTGSKKQRALPAPPLLQSLRMKDDHVFLDSEVGCALEAPEGPLPAAFQPILWGEENIRGAPCSWPWSQVLALTLNRCPTIYLLSTLWETEPQGSYCCPCQGS